MKRIIFASCVLLLFGLFLITEMPLRKVEAQRRNSSTNHSRDFVAGRLLVKFHSHIGRDHARQIIDSRKAKAGQHSLYSKAYHAAGNIGASQPITVYKWLV